MKLSKIIDKLNESDNKINNSLIFSKYIIEEYPKILKKIKSQKDRGYIIARIYAPNPIKGEKNMWTDEDRDFIHSLESKLKKDEYYPVEIGFKWIGPNATAMEMLGFSMPHLTKTSDLLISIGLVDDKEFYKPVTQNWNSRSPGLEEERYREFMKEKYGKDVFVKVKQ